MLHRDRAHARRCCTRSTILPLCIIPKQNLLRRPLVGWSVLWDIATHDVLGRLLVVAGWRTLSLAYS